MLFLLQCENPKRWFWKITKSNNSFPPVNKKKTCQNSPKHWVQSNHHSFICSLLKLVSLGVPQVLCYRCPYIEVSGTLFIKISIDTLHTYKQERLNLRPWFFLIGSKNLQAVLDKQTRYTGLSCAPVNLWDFFLCNCIPANMKVSLHLPCLWSYLFTFLIPGLLEKLSHETLWPEKNYFLAKWHRRAANSVEIM